MNVDPAQVCVLVLLLQAIILKRKGLPSSQLDTETSCLVGATPRAGYW